MLNSLAFQSGAIVGPAIGGVVVADCGVRSPLADCGANARLIAAAPAMHGLLIRLREWDHLDGAGDGAFWREQIEAVLATAKGA